MRRNELNLFPPLVIIFGGTGQAKAARPIIEHYGSRVAAVFDDTPGLSSPFPDVSIYQGYEAFQNWILTQKRSEIGFCIAIGNPHGRFRLKLHEILVNDGLQPVTLVHPAACIDESAEIGEGSQILAGAIIAADAVVGRQCIVNNNVVIEHEVTLADAVEVATSSTVLGLTSIGANTTIGAHTVVLSRLSVGSDVVIPAGSVIDSNIEDSSVVKGKSTRTH